MRLVPRRSVAFAAFLLCFGAVAQPGALDALTRFQDFEARRASSSNEDLTSNGDARGIEPGGTLVLADLEGPGIITHFWNTTGAYDVLYSRSLVLRFYYDGSEQPSVVAPLGDFFGVGHGAYKDFTSAPVTVSSHGRARTCYWRIPFRKNIRITLTNDSPDFKVDSFYYYIDWQKHAALPEDTAYFHALYRQEHPAQPGNYTILETMGRGHYVGTVHSAHQMELGWYGEGDDFFYIDEASEPQLRGTGTEDYFNDAWGFREFSTPYHGVSLYDGVFPGDRVTAYRWHIPDPIPFEDSLRVVIEHRGSVFNASQDLANFQLGSFEERPDWVSSVAFWYQYPPAALNPELPPVKTRTAPYRSLFPAKLAFRAEPEKLLAPGETGVTYVPLTSEAFIEFDFELDAPGMYQINGVFYHSIMGGVYQPYLDGKKLEKPLDLVVINADFIWRTLDQHKLEAGKHTLRFEGVDTVAPEARSQSPQFHYFGCERLLLLRLEDMEGYHQVLGEKLKALDAAQP